MNHKEVWGGNYEGDEVPPPEVKLDQQPPSSCEGIDEAIRSVSELREPIRNMITPVLEHMKGGEYGLLIGDDASGRIPTLIVRKIMNALYQKKGLPPIPTRFIAGTRSYKEGSEHTEQKQAKVSEYVRETLNSIFTPTRVLIVTDTIKTGSSLVPLTSALRESGVAYDICSVGFAGDPGDKPELARRLGDWVNYGMDDQPEIYAKHHISGVQKKYRDLHATSVAGAYSHNPEQEAFIRQNLSFARHEAGRVADAILSELASGDDATREEGASGD